MTKISEVSILKFIFFHSVFGSDIVDGLSFVIYNSI